MNYIDGIDMGFDTAESQDAMAADHQIALDVLYRKAKWRRVSAVQVSKANDLSAGLGAED